MALKLNNIKVREDQKSIEKISAIINESKLDNNTNILLLAYVKSMEHYNINLNYEQAYNIIKQVNQKELYEKSTSEDIKVNYLLAKCNTLIGLGYLDETKQIADSLLSPYKNNPKYSFRIWDIYRYLNSRKGNFEEAHQNIKKIYKNAIIYRQKYPNPENEFEKYVYSASFFSTLMLANDYFEQEKYDSANIYYKKSIRDLNLISDTYQKITANIYLSHYFRSNKDYKDARKRIKIASNLSNKHYRNHIGIQSNLNYALADYYKDTNQRDSLVMILDKQIKFEDEYNRALKSISSKISKEIIVENKNVISRSKKLIILTIFLLVIAIVLSFTTANYYRKIKKYDVLDNNELPDKKNYGDNNDTEKQLLQEVINAAKNNSDDFTKLYSQLHPDFFSNLLKIDNSLKISELKFCALLSLFFTTKEIANYTHTSVRTVQTRKYQLRKKFNIPSDEDIYSWIIKFL